MHKNQLIMIQLLVLLIGQKIGKNRAHFFQSKSGCFCKCLICSHLVAWTVCCFIEHSREITLVKIKKNVIRDQVNIS